MSNNQLPADVESRLDAAVKRRSLSHDYASGYKEGYIAGATAENERAQKLADALEKIKAWHSPGHSAAWAIIHIKNIAIQHLQQWKGEKGNEWRPISMAPKDGRTIEVSYDAEYKETYLACWSNNPICMLGPRNGSFPPGWATPAEADCDTNLPLDPPLFWRELKGKKEVGDE